jgi:hypothetical protein
MHYNAYYNGNYNVINIIMQIMVFAGHFILNRFEKYFFKIFFIKKDF